MTKANYSAHANHDMKYFGLQEIVSDDFLLFPTDISLTKCKIMK